ncbi:MAG: DUF799 family lipoprotein [Deltaproteobacteria bacterium]|nr:DUF799 family lipoprotein [Deltaproteobacteria bacterium]
MVTAAGVGRANGGWRFFLLLCGIAVLLSACAGVDRKDDDARFAHSVAALPLYNATNDVEGPRMVRDQAAGRMKRLRYRNMPVKDVDLALRDRLGITLGSQLDLATPQELGAELGVDYLLYGYLLDFDTITTGIYNVNKVRAAFKLVEAKSGRVVWSRAGGVRNEIHSAGEAGVGIAALIHAADKGDAELYKTIPGLEGIPGLTDWKTGYSEHEKSVGTAALFSLGEQLVTQALGVHLYIESYDMLDRIMGDFPRGE